MQGFLDGMQANGLPVDEDLIVEAKFRQPSGRSGANHLLDLPDPPSAIVTCNDLLALAPSAPPTSAG
jgi:DNA-binding LacI/PurR family transcriptional regulator